MAQAEVKAEWIASQKRTFTKWMNNHLRKKGFGPIEDAETSFDDGIVLMNIVNALYDVPIPKHNNAAKMRVHKLDNIALSLQMVEQAQIKTNFLKREHLVDHDLKMILGMMWAIILDYAIKGISVEDQTAKEGLLLWCRKKTAGYRDVDPPGVQNFSTSWRSGMALCALIHRHRPDLIQYDGLDVKNEASNLELAFSVAEKDLDIPRLLEVEDLLGTERPDERSVMTYISEFFHRFAQQDIRENAARRVAKFLKFTKQMEQLQTDYESRARALLQWTADQSAEFAAAPLGDTLDEASASHAAFRNHLTSVKPPKLAEKLDVETLYAELQTELLVNNRKAYNAPAEITVDALEAAFDNLAKSERERGQAVRNNRFRFITKEESKLPQEKIDEITASFKHFDKNSNGSLEKIEFKAALSALGVPFKTEDDFNRVFAQVTEGAPVVSLEQYIRYSAKIYEDRDSPDQVRDSFLLLSDNAADISAQQLYCPPLSQDDVAYLASKMPQNDQGRLDFNAFIANTFSSAQ